MKVQGVIYDRNWLEPSGEVWIKSQEFKFAHIAVLATLWQLNFSKFAHGAGLALIALGLTGLTITLYPIASPEIGYRVGKIFNSQEKTYKKAVALAYQKDIVEKQEAFSFAQTVGISDTSFSIYIPKIEAKSRVIKNVDAGNEQAYKIALKEGVAHASGSSFPDSTGATYLFAHSTDIDWNVTRYNAVFYLLRELNPENRDEIFLFYKDRLYKYRVAKKHIVDADDVSWLNGAPYGEERLILQTCWPPGTIWKRLIIVAYPLTT